MFGRADRDPDPRTRGAEWNGSDSQTGADTCLPREVAADHSTALLGKALSVKELGERRPSPGSTPWFGQCPGTSMERTLWTATSLILKQSCCYALSVSSQVRGALF